jgi:hypothetical protein
MTRDELKQAFRDGTATPPPGARERVWRELSSPRVNPQRTGWLLPALAFCACVALGVVATRALLPRDTSAQWSDAQSAVVWTQARAARTERTVTLERGEVAVSSWGAPVEVAAKGHVIRVDRGVAVIRVAGDSVTAEVVDGVLSFDGETRQAGPRPVSSPLLATLEALESPTSRPQRLSARAERALAERRFEDAARAFAEVASSGSLDAEVANFKKGDLELRELSRPEAALATFEAGESRFPSGALTQERALSAIESCVKLGRWAEVEQRTASFLSRHADSERSEEVHLLHARAVGARGDWKTACVELSALPSERGASLRSQCP